MLAPLKCKVAEDNFCHASSPHISQATFSPAGPSAKRQGRSPPTIASVTTVPSATRRAGQLERHPVRARGTRLLTDSRMDIAPELRDMIVSRMDFSTAAAFARTARRYYNESEIPVYSKVRQAKPIRGYLDFMKSATSVSGQKKRHAHVQMTIKQKTISTVIMAVNATKIKEFTSRTQKSARYIGAIEKHLKNFRDGFDPKRKIITDKLIDDIMRRRETATDEAAHFLFKNVELRSADVVKLLKSSPLTEMKENDRNNESIQLHHFEVYSALKTFENASDKSPGNFQKILDECRVEHRCYELVAALSQELKIAIPPDFLAKHDSPHKGELGFGLYQDAPPSRA